MPVAVGEVQQVQIPKDQEEVVVEQQVDLVQMLEQQIPAVVAADLVDLVDPESLL
jgi:hypothetical protein